LSTFDLEFADIRTQLNYEAWEWLPHDKWTPDNLLMEQRVNGCRQCKVNNCWVSPGMEEAHVAAHVEFDKQRREANKLLNAELTGKPIRVKRETLELILPEGEFTANQVCELNSSDRAATRSAILKMVATGELEVAGTVKGGGRGRPAVLYKEKE